MESNSYIQSAERFFENTSNQISVLMTRQFGHYYPLVTFSSVLSILIVLASFPPIPLFIGFDNNDDISNSLSNQTLIPTSSPTVFNSTFHGNNTKSPSTANNYVPINRITSSDSNSDVFLYIVLTMAFMYSLVVILRMFHVLRQRQRMVGMVNNMSNNTGQIRQLLQSLSRPGRGAGNSSDIRSRLRLAMMNRDFTGDDFDLLRQLDDMESHGQYAPGPGLEQGEINRLPLHTITEKELLLSAVSPTTNTNTTTSSDTEGDALIPGTDIANNNNNINNKNSNSNVNTSKCCSVCLAPYEVGDSVRTITCLHQFHRECIDTWLRTHSTCPICKFAVVVD